MKRVITISLCCLSVLLFCLTGCSKEEEKSIHDKLDAELEYIEDLIFKIANKYAKNEYDEEDKINWQWIKDDVGKMNDAWGTLILDLTEVDIQNQDIMEFSKDLNDLIIAMHDENAQNMLNELSDMYKRIIIFKQAYSEDKNKIQKYIQLFLPKEDVFIKMVFRDVHSASIKLILSHSQLQIFKKKIE